MNSNLTRAALLIEHQRWELAENELRQALLTNSDDAEAHRLLAICFNESEKFDAAESEAKMAVHLAPDDAATHFTLALVLLSQRRIDDALKSIDESLRLEPLSADSFAVQSQIRFIKRDWPGTLASAEQGLRLNPEHESCNNLRAMALTKLGRQAEAGITLEAVLNRNPNDPITHANEGWRLLETRDRVKAMEHFREALRLDPTNDWARRGIIEALKSKNIIYRLLLNYFLFMAKLSSRAQWMIILGFFIGRSVIADLARANPAAAPYLNMLLIGYAIFALLTWLGDPLFNLMLFLDRFGRLTLFPEQKRGALAVGGILGLALLIYVLGWQLSDSLLGVSAVYIALCALPVSAIFNCPPGWPFWAMTGMSAVVTGVGLVPLYVDLTTRMGLLPKQQGEALLVFTATNFATMFIVSQFLAMLLMNVTLRR